jgi:broad specificity phosphatase PhoE
MKARQTPVIYLVRHGETTWNAAGRQQGRLDSPLTAKGVGHAQSVRRALRLVLADAGKVTVETSPLGRAQATAAIICAELGIPADDVAISPLLIEHDLGVWQGLTFAEIDERYPGARGQREADKWHYRVEGGESYALVSERARLWLSTRTAALIIAVTHEMISRTIQGAYGALTPRETIGRSHRHGQIYRLYDGEITELLVDHRASWGSAP